jgi:glutathione S-transferase
MSLTLYYHPLSSYCHKVLIALYESGTEFTARLINLGDADDRKELQALWPICKFPVIRDDARQCEVAEASIIIEYLDHHFRGQHPLIPPEWEAALRVRLWDRIFDNYVHGPVQEIVNDKLRGSQGDMSAARSRLLTAYRMVDRQAAADMWICGSEFSLADCAAAPALFYAGTLQEFPQECGQLIAYFERLADRPSFQRVLHEAKPHFSLYPFAQAIPERFRQEAQGGRGR